MTNAERVKILYYDRKDKGLCVSCGGTLDRDGVRCKKCRDRQTTNDRENRRVYRESHVCPSCRKNTILGDEMTCPECRAKGANYAEKLRERSRDDYNGYMRKYQKNMYQKRKEDGICTRCGKRKAEHGFFTCPACRKKGREQKALKSQEKIPRTERYLHGRCFFCDQKIKEGYKVCEAHYAQILKMSDLPQTKEARKRMRKEGILY